MNDIKSANPANKTEMKYFLYKPFTVVGAKSVEIYTCGYCNKPINDNEFIEELDLKPRQAKDDRIDYPFYIFHYGCLDKWLKEHRDPVIVAQI